MSLTREEADLARDADAAADDALDKRIAELVALRDAASRCDCEQECYCAKNFEYAEMQLEKLGVDPLKIAH